MNRRDFVRLVLGAAAAGAVFDVDKALWMPGAKTFFLPPAPPPADGFVALQLGDLLLIDHEIMEVVAITHAIAHGQWERKLVVRRGEPGGWPANPPATLEFSI